MPSLLILGYGDTHYTDRNPRRLFNYAKESGFEAERRDYSEIRGAPDFEGETIKVMLFFPYTFWNENCEVPEDTKLYGTSKRSYELLREFFLEVKGALQQRYASQQLQYVIPPESAALDRDKIAAIQRLKKGGVPTSELVSYQKLDDILHQISSERGVFVKCRYGAEGKGIMLLQESGWVTNYKVEGATLTNYGIYEQWVFTDITGRRDLLEQLLEQEVIVEKEIVVPEFFEGKKFDARAYVINGQVPHFFIRVNERHKVVTNYSQGAQVVHHPQTSLPPELIVRIREEAVKSAWAFSSNFLGVDIMVDSCPDGIKVVEVQTFTDFPDIKCFDLAKYLVSNQSGLFL